MNLKKKLGYGLGIANNYRVEYRVLVRHWLGHLYLQQSLLLISTLLYPVSLLNLVAEMIIIETQIAIQRSSSWATTTS